MPGAAGHTLPGSPAGKEQRIGHPLCAMSFGGGLRAPLPRRGQGLRAKEDKNSSRTHKFCHFFSCCARSAGSIKRALGKDAGAGGPGLGVFLLCSLMWNADLSGGPGVGRAHPTYFLSPPLLFSSSFLQSRNYARFFAMVFRVDMKGLSPKRQLRMFFWWIDNHDLQFLAFPVFR